MKGIKSTFYHSLKMVGYNIKAYRLLSVTVVLSFSFLLAFFVFSDSNIYNNFKEVFKLPDNLQFVTYRNDEKAKLFTENLDKMYDTYYYYYFQNNARFTNYDREDSQIIGFFFYVPMDTSNIFLSYGKHSKVELIHGRLNLLEKNEVVIPNKLYQFLENKAIIKIPLIDVEGNSIVRDFKIVGVVEDIIFADKDDTAYWPTIILPRDIVYDYDLDIVNRHILIRSANPLYTNKLAHSLGHASNTTYRLHSEANKEISMQILLKGFALAILFVLLSINLYSSFSNALSDRRFEIGVKRAIGASKKHIIWQFFFEGMIVMIVDIIISIYLVFNIVLFYKLYKLIRFDYQWTIYINKFSLVAFVFVTLFLSNIFSLIFAFKSTQVEIVDHLKLE